MTPQGLSQRKRNRVDSEMGRVARKHTAAQKLGERTRFYRKQKGLTKTQMALELGCHWTTINNIERGPGAFSMSVYRQLQLARILEIDVNILLKHLEV